MASNRTLKVLSFVAGAAAMAAAAFAAPGVPDYDQGVRTRPFIEEARSRAAAAAPPQGVELVPPAPEDGSVWISVGKDDLSHPAGMSLPLGVPVMSSARASVFRVAVDRLPQIAAQMHEKFHKCGGFFAHSTQAEAEADLKAPPSSTGGPYSVDQAAWVKPMAARVREGELRSTIETLAGFNNRYYTADTGVAAANWIAGRWAKLAEGVPGASVRLFNHSGWKQPSVILTIPGSESPQEVVVLGGHLDSISGYWGGASARAPGADDNASGIAVLTEAVRVLGETGFKPKRTIQVMGYAAEEVGLRGSAEVAKSYQGSGAKVVGVIQFDMTNFAGSGEAIYLLTDNVDSALTAYLAKLVDAYTGVGAAQTRCGYGCSDHASWTRSGFPASAAFESAFDTMNRSIHSDKDTLGNSGGNAEHSVAFAKLAVAFAVETAKPAGSANLADAAQPKGGASR